MDVHPVSGRLPCLDNVMERVAQGTLECRRWMGKPAQCSRGIAEADADSRKRRCVWHL